MITYIPDGMQEQAAIFRTTHLAISAHQDDIEFMAYAPIAECFGNQDKWFGAIVVTDGAGSPRSGGESQKRPIRRLYGRADEGIAHRRTEEGGDGG